jgi:[acyl-carrier-protein] S-malonyltransferase
MSLALIFPGQGSQTVGMARALAAAEPIAAETLREADDILGIPLSELMAEGPEDELTATKNAQPALLAHSVAILRVIHDRLGPVAFTAGHSLGEFSAHVASGTLGFADALAAVRVRGELMFEAGLQRPGTMAAVLGLDDEQATEVCARVDRGVCVPANFNAPGQVVVSGDVEGVKQLAEIAPEAGAKKVIILNVSGAFHSPLMEPAARGLREHLESIDFQDPTVPVISNVTARPVTLGPEARDLLVSQLTSAVRWSDSIATMVEKGVDRFLELGPGKVLAGLNKRNAKGLPSISVGEPDDLEGLKEIEA